MFSPAFRRTPGSFAGGRARAALLLAALMLLAAAPAAAQIPTGPRSRPTNVRPSAPTRPAGEQQRPAGRRPGEAGAARGDTVPGDSGRVEREVVQDSTIDALLRLPGYVPVEYQGDSAQFDNRERTLRLRGNPVVTRGTDKIEARDSIVYRERSDFVEVYGDPRVTGEGQDIEGDVIFYDLTNRRASVENARTTVTEGATWYVQGNVTTENQGERVYATGGTFTSDDRPEPAYYFRASKLKVIKNRVLVGRPAYLVFRGVPVFVLPFIVQDLGRGRRSGFLIPEFEINDLIRTDQRGRGTRGTGRQIGNVGYYWAINDYMGMQAALNWRSQSWIGLDVGYQFNWARKFLTGNASLQRFWRDEGANQFNLLGSGSWKPNERTDISTALNYTSSTQFERDRIIDPFRQTSDVSSTLSFSRRMDWGTLTSGAELRQSIATGDNNLRTRLSISPETITLFGTGEGAEPRWYNDAALTISMDGSADRVSPGDALTRRQQGQQNADASVGGSLRFGPISVAGTTRYNRQTRGELAAIDTTALAEGVEAGRAGFIPGYGTETFDWGASTGYEFRLMGSTRLTPSISLTQQLVRRDTAFEGGVPPAPIDVQRYGQFVAGPTRMNFGAGLRTELFGFFPGVAGYSAIRHHLSPELSYRFTPEVAQNSLQDAVFGAQHGREQNEVTFTLNQTFEGKLREPARREGEETRAGTGNPADAAAGNAGAQTDSAGVALDSGQAGGDTAGADSAGAGGGEPEQAQKVTLLAINTSSLVYSFVPVDVFGTRFTTSDITNSIRSDLLGGLNFTISHDLFREELGDTPDPTGGGGLLGGGRKTFSPFLTGVQTSLSFGAGSALFRWLGFSRATEEERRTERGQTPPGEGVAAVEPPGSQTSTGRAMPSGNGSWNVSLSYSLRRTRPLAVGELARADGGNQQISGNVSFFPTRNWAVSWYTDYSISENEFGTHVLNFKRDLYRWQANFDFVRAPNGNTSFSFSVHLQDLPDLKADYSRQNLGADRAQVDDDQ
ncbi:MAG TPA: putative LPS assembly protein LptD [Longimicrobium sp.]|nr:putative LPS assembly protein LptD [Longimicrobium sp.]